MPVDHLPQSPATPQGHSLDAAVRRPPAATEGRLARGGRPGLAYNRFASAAPASRATSNSGVGDSPQNQVAAAQTTATSPISHWPTPRPESRASSASASPEPPAMIGRPV